jgi:hypothetical protein
MKRMREDGGIGLKMARLNRLKACGWQGIENRNQNRRNRNQNQWNQNQNQNYDINRFRSSEWPDFRSLNEGDLRTWAKEFGPMFEKVVFGFSEFSRFGPLGSEESGAGESDAKGKDIAGGRRDGNRRGAVDRKEDSSNTGNRGWEGNVDAKGSAKGSVDAGSGNQNAMESEAQTKRDRIGNDEKRLSKEVSV